MIKIFLSNFDVTEEIASERDMERIQRQFKQDLNDSNFLFFDGGSFTGYENIFNELNSSTHLIAFIDNYWTSSTWKVIELWYGAGESPEHINHTYIGKPLETFIYSHGVDNVNLHDLLERDNVHQFDGTLSGLKKLIDK